MINYSKSVEIRWADLDPNFHMLHSKYYDFGAYVRMCYLVEHGLTPENLRKNMLGPILFREECIFRKEILFGDKVEIDLVLVKARKDGSRFSFRHQIMKNGDQLAAILNVDGAWMDLGKRKLTGLPPELAETFLSIPKAEEFEWQV